MSILEGYSTEPPKFEVIKDQQPCSYQCQGRSSLICMVPLKEPSEALTSLGLGC